MIFLSKLREIMKMTAPKKESSSLSLEAITGTAQTDNSATISTVERAGICFVAEEITSKEALKQSVSFSNCLNKEILAKQFHNHIALVRIHADKPACALFVVNDRTSDEEIHEILRLVEKEKLAVAQAYFAITEIIVQISQGSLDAKVGVTKQEKSDPLWEQFKDIVAWAYDNKADDIDFAYDNKNSVSQVAFKIEGFYARPKRFLIQSDVMRKILGAAYAKGNGGGESGFDPLIVQQCQIEMKLINGADVKLRWGGLPNEKGTTVTLRKHVMGATATVRSLNDCGYLPSDMDIFERALRSKRGMIVFAGEVGSGKSNSLSTLARMLPPSLKIQTIEDPVELEIPNAYQTTVVRDLTQSGGTDSGFSSVTKAIFRSALDVLYLGEIRDTASGAVAKQVLQSGHALLTTVHAQDGPGIISRFTSDEIGIPASVLATRGIIKLLVYQSLLPTNCPHCALTVEQYLEQFDDETQHKLELAYFERLVRLYKFGIEHYRLRNQEGCQHCRKPDFPERNGMSGRTTVYEIIEVDDKMRQLIASWNPITFERYWRSLSDSQFDSPNLTGKTAQECGIYKAYLGLIDPREIEKAFTPFETIEINLQNKEKHQERCYG